MINLQGNLNSLSFDMTIIGEGFVLFAALSSSVSAVLIRRFSQKDDAVMLSG